MGQVGNQRNYRILTLKKRLGKERKKERKKKNIVYRVASNERRLIIDSGASKENLVPYNSQRFAAFETDFNHCVLLLD